MPPALGGVDLKLRRAKHHLEAIKRQVSEFDYGPEQIPGEYDAQTDTHIFRAHHDPPPADALSARVGEFLYNVRCALDYIVYELITGEGNPVDTRKAFPIYTTQTWYDDAAPDKIKGVPSASVAVFERLQPFYGPNSDPFHPDWRDPEREPLAVLLRLNDRDKHRMLTFTESVGSIEPVFPDGRETFTRPAPVRFGPFKRGAILASFAPGSLEPDVKVNLATTFYIGIYEEGPSRGEDLIQSLNEILRVARDRVVPAFARFFPG